MVGVTLSRGLLCKIVGKVTRALEKPYAELLALLPSVAVTQVDETGHNDHGEPWWTWCCAPSSSRGTTWMPIATPTC